LVEPFRPLIVNWVRGDEDINQTID